jgi:signal transduction histidine kinase
MKEFMHVRIGRLHGSVVIILAAIPAIVYYRMTSIFVIADILFYFVLYAVYFLCFLSVDHGLRFEKGILLTAWIVTSAMRFLDLFCEAGVLPSGRLNLLLRLRGIVSVVYIIAFFAIVCKRFADKFNAADQLNAKLEKKVEERSRDNMVFVRSMLHNMKTPVFSLNGYSNMATDMLVSNPERAKVYLSKINEKTLYLGQLMDQISLVTRMDAGVLEMKKTSLNIPDILKHCIDNARVTADSKHIRIIMECEEAAFVIADPIYLTQAIQNVLDNAVIHTGENGEIVLSSEKSPYTMSWLIRIRDNGCGINAEEQGENL